MTTQAFDPSKAEAFGGQMLSILNGAALASQISLGYRTGLLDTLAGLPASTSEQIAQAAGLHERYVREWLAAMVTGRIVEYEPTAHTYRLPAEHAAMLTRAAGPNNMAAFTPSFAMLGLVEDQLVECFRHGGGVPYAAYPKFQEFMAALSAQTYDASLIAITLPLVPGLPERLTTGIDVADLGCGQGHAINLMATSFPASRFVGYDFSEQGLSAARNEAQALGLTNVRFEQQDAALLAVREGYDLVTVFDAIHDQAQPGIVLRNIYQALRPGGTFLMVDVAASSNLEENLDHPLAPMMYTASVTHCMTVSLAQGGAGLGTMWGEQKACQMLAEAGFTVEGVKRIEGDVMNAYYIAAKA